MEKHFHPFQLNQLETQVQILAAQGLNSPADIRMQLMRQYNLSFEQYAVLNPKDIRGTLGGGKGFFGGPG